MTSPIAQQWQLDAAVTALAIAPDDTQLAVATADGATLFFDLAQLDASPLAVPTHAGVAFQLVPDLVDSAFVSAGDDGKLQQVTRTGVTTLANHKGAWIEHVLVAPTLGQRFYAVKKEVHRLDATGAPLGQAWVHDSTVAGIALEPKERRLAVAHYNGVTLWWTKAKESAPEKLQWKGSHTGVLWHPKEMIVVTTMQEPAMHGWRIGDKAEMRMTGYDAKVTSAAFMEGGKYLASAGSGAVICWPFFGGGPWGKQPLMVGPDTGATVSLVRPHPHDPIIAVAYENGALALVPLFEQGALKLLEIAGAPVTCMRWTTPGDKLFAGTEDGKLFLFTVESVSQAFRT